MSDPAASTSNSQYELLPARSEYRFELEPGERLAIRLVPASGDAEIFGAEFFPGEDRWYHFGDEAKGCVCSWNGCQIEISPPPSAAYLSLESSPIFSSYSTLHLHLERARIQARNALRATPQLVYDLRAASEAEEGADVYRNDGQGPRILLLGPEASGKSSLARFLCNYALRSPATTDVEEADINGMERKETVKPGEQQESEATGWWPVLLNLDPSAGAPPLPCIISANPLSPLPQAALTSASPTLPFGITAPISGSLPPTASAVSISSPISFWLGREHFREEDEHGRSILEKMAGELERRMCRDMKARMSGFIVDTAGTTSADSRNKYAMIRHIVKLFHIDTILVLGQEKVTIDLTRLLASSPDYTPRPTVLKLPKSGGVVEIDEAFRSRLRSAQIRSYFYGGMGSSSSAKAANPDADPASAAGAESATKIPGSDDPLGYLPHLNPYSQTIPLDLLEVYRVGQEKMAPSSALPIGASRTLKASTLHQLDPVNSAADQAALLNSVLAIVDPPCGGGGKGQKDSEVWKAELGEERGEKETAAGTIRGFIHVQAIDAIKKRMTVLAPAAGRLPSKTALLGTLDWQDS